MARFCHECGKRTEEGDNFCSHCGRKLRDKTSSESPSSELSTQVSLAGDKINRNGDDTLTKMLLTLVLEQNRQLMMLAQDRRVGLAESDQQKAPQPAPYVPKPWIKTVNCYPHISHSDTERFIRDHHDRLKPEERRLLQEATTLVTNGNEPDWVWGDAQLTVNGPLMQAIFVSGDRANKFLVHLTEDDRPTYVVQSKGWKLMVKDGFKTAWSWIKGAAKGVAKKVAGAITSGAAMLAIE